MNVLVMGMGKSGIAVSRLMDRQGHKIYVYDDNIIVKGYNEYDNKVDIDMVVVSPSINYEHKLLQYFRDKGVKIISELELGLSLLKSAYIAITGTNGKTTTTLLVNDILNLSGISSIAIGNIGEPVCNYVDFVRPNDYAVVEISSFQLENTKILNPSIVAITNISPDHLDRHQSYQDYISTKLSIVENISKTTRVVINYDDEILRDFSYSLDMPITYFSYDNRVDGCYIVDKSIYYKGQWIMELDDIAMSHKFNIYNAMCAIAITLPMGVHLETIREALRSFTPPQYRMAYRGIIGGKEFFNDSKATNIDSTLKACKAMQGDTVLIMGGSDKGEDFDGLFKDIPHTIRHILVVGDNASKIIQSATKYECNIMQMKSLLKCVEYAKTLDVKCVLFSPASASYDKYTDYMERGAYFDCLI